MITKFIKKDKIHDGPFEAGQTRGMGIEKVLSRYLKSRNLVLKLLRIYLNIPIETVAESLNISVDELIELEKSQKLVPFQLIPNLSKIFNTDLKTLLVVLGHAKESKNVVDQQGELSDIKIAAQYSGPELSKEEKVDLDELLKLILNEIDRTGGK